MNKSQLFVRWSIGLFVPFLTVLPLAVQLEASINNSDAIYQVGETGHFQVNAIFSGAATYNLI